MGLPRVVGAFAFLLGLVALPGSVAAAPEPVVFALGWGDLDERWFPHPALCVGDARLERHRVAAPGYYFDPDGCGYNDEARLGVGATTPGRSAPVLYLQPSAAERVRAGDARIVAGPGHVTGSVVAPGDLDEGAHTHPWGTGRWDFHDRDHDGRWSAGDTAYLDDDEGGYLTPGDLVLDQNGLRFAPLGTPGMHHALRPLEETLCFLDDDANGSHEASEALYLSTRGCSLVAAGDLRLQGARGLPSGIPVREADRDHRSPLTAFAPPQGAIGRLSGHVLIDLDGSGTESAGDLRVVPRLGPVGQASGDVVQPGGRWAVLEPDDPLRAVPLLYLDMDENDRVGPGDVRMSALFGKAAASRVAPDDPDATAPLPGRGVFRSDPGAEPRTALQDEAAPGPAFGLLLSGVGMGAHALRKSCK